MPQPSGKDCTSLIVSVPNRPGAVPGHTSQKGAASAATTGHEAIAIIGLACHYPGGVDTPAAFWQQLVAGFDGISDLPQTRAVDLGLTALAA